MDVNYDYYRVFYHVARSGSFSRAAEQLGSNQPNVTKLMNKLEAQLGCRLLLRSNKGVRLTAEGEKLMSHVEVAYSQLQQGELELTGRQSLSTGMVRIGATETALHGILLPVLADFHRNYPGVRLMISNHSTPQAVAALRRGAVDLALVTSPTGAPPDLRQRSLREFREILISGEPMEEMTLAQVAARPTVGLGRHTKTFDFYARLFWEEHAEWRPDIDAATADQILPLVKAGLGMGFLPEFMAADALASREVFEVPLASGAPMRELVLLEDPACPLSAAAKTLRDLLLR